eukprot:2090131-Rhodomonas_salina.1
MAELNLRPRLGKLTLSTGLNACAAQKDDGKTAQECDLVEDVRGPDARERVGMPVEREMVENGAMPVDVQVSSARKMREESASGLGPVQDQNRHDGPRREDARRMPDDDARDERMKQEEQRSEEAATQRRQRAGKRDHDADKTEGVARSEMQRPKQSGRAK